MRIELQDSFVEKLERQVDYIARDKPLAARKFKSNLLRELKKLRDFPFHYKPSIYFQDENVRDMTYRGYTIVYKVDLHNDVISIFGLVKFQEGVE